MRMVLENPKVYFNQVSSTIALHFSFTNHDMELSYCFLIFFLPWGNFDLVTFAWHVSGIHLQVMSFYLCLQTTNFMHNQTRLEVCGHKYCCY